jgi:beta-propeller repeat-containing protein
VALAGASAALFRKAALAVAGLGLLAITIARVEAQRGLPASGDQGALHSYENQLSFVENGGQLDSRVRYYAHGPGFGFYFTKREAMISLANGKRGAALALGFQGANPNATLTAGTMLPGKANYLHGDNPARWQTGLRTHGEVRYRALWPGIDMVFRGGRSGGGKLEYEFHLRPGANVNDIRLAYRGARGVALGGGGSLLVRTPVGTLKDAKPVSYQTIGGKRVPVASRYTLHGERSAYGFALGASYDPGRPLVIDPALVYSTFLGGADTDAGFDIAVEPGGSSYVTGYAYSPDFPTTTGAYDTTSNGSADAFVTKLDPSGNLIYSTYLGGTGNDFGNGISVDGGGNAYLAGDTSSDDFPTTPGAFDTTPDSSPFVDDAFVTKLNPSGSALSYSTYLGGLNNDHGYDVVVDAGGSAYVGGETGSAGGGSTDFPTTPGAYSTTATGGADAFVTKLNASGSALTYSTFLGGSINERIFGIALDGAGSAFVTGDTVSPDFPTTPGAYDSSFAGDSDGFVTKLNSAGSGLAYSTYLGGNSTELPRGIAVDAGGSAYAAGDTFSQDFPTTTGAYDTTNAGNFDSFVAKLNPTGTALTYSTFLGGQNSETPADVAVDATGSAHVAGATNSADYQTTPGAYDTSYNGSDAIVTKLDPSGSGLSYSTYLGGTGFDGGNGIGLDGGGAVHVAGVTESADFPTTPGAHDTTYNGSFDAFAATLDLTAPPASTPGCATSTNGQIVAQNRDRASFNGRANTSATGQPSGSQTYSDRGPADQVEMRSTSIDALVCDGRDASIFGRALVNGNEVTFQIDLHDGNGRSRDTYRIVLGSGYDSGKQSLRSGHVRVR